MCISGTQPLVFRRSNEFEGQFPFLHSALVAHKMGDVRCYRRFGWVRCYWCELWIKDFSNCGSPCCAEPKCHDCFDQWITHNGEPMRPNAICHRTNVLELLLRQRLQCDSVLRHIASFLEGWEKPGAGSRRHPIMI